MPLSPPPQITDFNFVWRNWFSQLYDKYISPSQERHYTTIALAAADIANISIGDVVYPADRGGTFDVVAYSAPNGFDTVDGDGSTKMFQLRAVNPINITSVGATSATDNRAAIQRAIEMINDGGELTADYGTTYKIIGALVIPTRLQASQIPRMFRFGGATLEQVTDNTPMFEVVAETSNIVIADFHAQWTNSQAATQTNASVIQYRDPESTAEFAAYPSGTQGMWNNLIENITTGGVNYPASIISEKIESSTYSMAWGTTYRRLYTFSSRRAIFNKGSGNVTGVANKVENCVFFGISGEVGSVPFVELRIWTESKIDQVEFLTVAPGAEIISTTGCDIELANVRIENCALSTNATAFILLSGTNNIAMINDVTFTNCDLTSGVSAEAYGIKSFASKVNVNGVSIAGSTSLDIQGAADFYMLRVDGDGEICYSNLLRSNHTETITAATQANPCNITMTGHSLTTGAKMTISDVVGMTELNGNTYTITVVDADNVTLGVDSTAFTAYTSGGIAQRQVYSYKNSDNKNLVVGNNEVNYSWVSTLDGATGSTTTQQGMAIVSNDGYLIEAGFSTEANLGTTIVANLAVNGTIKISTTFSSGGQNANKGNAPVFLNSIPVTKSDILTFTCDAKSQTTDIYVVCKVLQFRLI